MSLLSIDELREKYKEITPKKNGTSIIAVAIMDVLDIDVFRKYFYYDDEFFSKNKTTLPAAAISIIDKINDLGSKIHIRPLSEDKKSILFNPDLDSKLTDLDYDSIYNIVELYSKNPILADRFKKEKAIDIFNEISADKTGKVFFFQKCSIEKDCVSKLCSKCEFVTEISLKISSKEKVEV